MAGSVRVNQTVCSEKDFWPCGCHLVQLPDLRGHDDLRQGGLLSSGGDAESARPGYIFLHAEDVQTDGMSNADWIDFHSCRHRGSLLDIPLSGLQKSLPIVFCQTRNVQSRRDGIGNIVSLKHGGHVSTGHKTSSRKTDHLFGKERIIIQQICFSFEWTRIRHGR